MMTFIFLYSIGFKLSGYSQFVTSARNDLDIIAISSSALFKFAPWPYYWAHMPGGGGGGSKKILSFGFGRFELL